jgi:hypothetical protein
MTSLNLYSDTTLESRPVYEWGTGDHKDEKSDPTLIKGPTFLLKYNYFN